MELLDKEIATLLFDKGKMPTWFYRQNYKSEKENFTETHQKMIDFIFSQKISISDNTLEEIVQNIKINLFEQ